MFNTISWPDYWTTIAFVTLGYYAFVWLFYFRKANVLPGILKPSNNLIKGFTSATQEEVSEVNNDFKNPEVGTQEHLVYACVDEINAFIAEAKKARTVKAEFLSSIGLILTKYPTLASSEYKEGVTSVIISEAQHHCSIHLTAEEADSVWFGG